MADISDVNVREISDLHQRLEGLSCTVTSFSTALKGTNNFQLAS